MRTQPKRILFFTEGQAITEEEQAVYNDVVAASNNGDMVGIRWSGGKNYTGGAPEPADYVYGAIPNAYRDHEVFTLPVQSADPEDKEEFLENQDSLPGGNT